MFDRVREHTGIPCPITNGELIYTGHDLYTLDGPGHYESSVDPKVKFELWPRGDRHYYLVGSNRSFQRNSQTWEEYFTEFGHLFPLGTSRDQVDLFVQKLKREQRRRNEEYQRKVKSGEIVPGPFATKVMPTLVKSEIVKVQPMSPPRGTLNYLNYTYKQT